MTANMNATTSGEKPSWTIIELVKITAGKLHGQPKDVRIATISTDTRTLQVGDLFIALRGDNFDGHAYLGTAIEKGAAAVVVDSIGEAKGASAGCAVIVVKDTLRAYGDIARAARRDLAPRPVIAVTGSNGKTTTKELIAAVLSERAPVHKTTGNLNNLVGVPQTLLQWSEDTWAAVVEMGMNAPGEIARLTEIAEPTIGVITCVAPAHLEGLGSIEGVARAKGELFAGLPENAVAIVNADDAQVMRICAAALSTQKRLTFGTHASCDVQLLGYTPNSQGLEVRLRIASEQINAQVPLVGPHNALNAAAASAVGLALGMRAAEIVSGLANVSLPGARVRVLRDVGIGIGILDDTYNANPSSMQAAFATLRDLAGTARRIGVLGDMFELGTHAAQLHYETGAAAAASGIERIFTLGPNAEETARGAGDHHARAQAFASLEELLAALLAEVKAGDWVVVKGSRGMRMEKAVAALLGGHS